MTDRSPLVAPHLRDLHPYEPGKPIDELKRELDLESIIKLASNENAYGPSPKVAHVLRDVPLQLYPDPTGYELRQALATHHGIAFDEVCLGNGSNELIDLICRVFGAREDHVVFGDPSFLCYRIGSIAEQLPFTAVPLRDHLAWNVDDLLQAVTPRTKLLFVANPNNPTGSYIAKNDLRRLLEELPSRVIAVVDEAYVEFADAKDYASALNMREARERLVVLRTFSKAYGLAALRIGYSIAPAELTSAIQRLRPPFNANALAQRAAQVALADQDHVQESAKAIQADRRRLASALEDMGLRVAPSQANFVLVQVRGEGRAVYERLLRHGVIVRAMGEPIADWIRVTVGRPEENDRFLQALAAVLS